MVDVAEVVRFAPGVSNVNMQMATMLCGYTEANEFIEAERMARLSRMTPAESRRIFEELYRLWERTGRQAGGDWEALERLKIERLIEQSQAFVRLAERRRGA